MPTYDLIIGNDDYIIETDRDGVIEKASVYVDSLNRFVDVTDQFKDDDRLVAKVNELFQEEQADNNRYGDETNEEY